MDSAGRRTPDITLSQKGWGGGVPPTYYCAENVLKLGPFLSSVVLLGPSAWSQYLDL